MLAWDLETLTATPEVLDAAAQDGVDSPVSCLAACPTDDTHVRFPVGPVDTVARAAAACCWGLVWHFRVYGLGFRWEGLVWIFKLRSGLAVSALRL